MAASTARRTRALLLGAGELGREIAIAFHRFGVEVHAADWYEGAPAAQVAHASSVVDLLDATALTTLVAQVQPDIIVPETERINTDALREIAANYRVVPSTKSLKNAFDREKIRRLASEDLGLPTSRYAFATSYEEFEEAAQTMGFPCIVKAVGSFSWGHSVVRNSSELTNAWYNAQPSTKVMVERFVNFDVELTLLVVRSIDPETGSLATWFCEPIGHRHQGGRLIESWQPIEISQVALDNARSVAARITNAIGGQGVFGVELFVAGEDVFFSSVSPRPHHTGQVTVATQRFDQYELHVRAILGLPIDVTLTSPGALATILAPAEGTTIRYRGLDKALAHPEVGVRLFAKPKAHVGGDMGVVVATAETVDQARVTALAAVSEITVEVSP